MIGVHCGNHFPPMPHDQEPRRHEDQQQNHNADRDDRPEIRVLRSFKRATAGCRIHTRWDAAARFGVDSGGTGGMGIQPARLEAYHSPDPPRARGAAAWAVVR